MSLNRVRFRGSVLLLAGALLAMTACHRGNSNRDEIMAHDPHSFAKPTEVVVRHLDLDITVNFERKQIAGRATLHITSKTGADTLFLDANGLSIEKVTLDSAGLESEFSLGEPVPYLGQALAIRIRPDTRAVNVFYHTRPEAEALQWLAPEQTAGKKQPYLFTQSQAILARTWVPCQDSPGVRMTYRATVRVPAGLIAVMSAENPQEKSPDGVYRFNMPQPVPSYLLALAVGDLEFRAISARSGVYSEPAVVQAAAWELADTEKMIRAAEKLYGPYRWGRYDVIVLPPSFPFGGMENPRLTFATPTILAGDRSLVALVAHELAHSWSGNLVTNATWNDFWLNEGFTVYFEHRIMEALYGVEYERMLAVLALQGLKKTVRELGEDSPDTRLHLDLADRDPDEGMTDIAYEKGHFLLLLLEETVGRERWDEFLHDYFEAFAFQSMTSERFIEYLNDNLLNDPALSERVRLQEWVYGTGLPDNCPQVQSKELDKVQEQIKLWNSGAPSAGLKTDGWSTPYWLYFLRNLPTPQSIERLLDLDQRFHLSDSHNSEILFEWLMHAVASKYTPAYPALQRFLTEQGRRKFLKPLYARLAETPEGLALAKRIYRQARPLYHPISSATVDKILGTAKSNSAAF